MFLTTYCTFFQNERMAGSNLQLTHLAKPRIIYESDGYPERGAMINKPSA